MEHTVERLGELLRRHPVESDRLLRLGAVQAAVGAVAMVIGAGVVIAMISGAEGGLTTAGMLLGVGVIILGLGIWRLVQWRRTRGESFDVHERGLVHRTSGTVTVAPWGEITKVYAMVDSLPLSEFRGTSSFSCSVMLRDGTGIFVDSFVEDVRQLAETVHVGWQIAQHGDGHGNA
ncbi:hypothetical protein [Nocardiopsis lucentensis]|uniref:hypothetical protein n=1 Tax=Nocardiopsis lucentensis TaxID=53441 RepID=UPI000349F269|nr:hypothetical protein [Nocardiopsis lucentensis]